MNLLITQQAHEELREAVRYYAGISPELGIRFYREMEQVINEIGDRPHLFREFEAPARRLFSDRFPYCVVYSIEADRPCIMAVMRLAREMRYLSLETGIKLTH